MIRNSATLKRWSTFAPGSRLPDSLDELPLGKQLELKEQDPDLYALLSNSASAELELAAMEGTLADSVPSAAERTTQANRAEAERLIADGAFPSLGYYDADGNYIEGREGNITAQMTIAQLAPDLYEAEMLRASAAKAAQQPAGLTAEGADFVNARLASMNAQGMS